MNLDVIALIERDILAQQIYIEVIHFETDNRAIRQVLRRQDRVPAQIRSDIDKTTCIFQRIDDGLAYRLLVNLSSFVTREESAT